MLFVSELLILLCPNVQLTLPGIWLAVSLVWLAIQGIMIALGPDLETEFQIATAMFGTLFGVLSLLFSITMVLVQKNLDPAKVAEAQLRQSFFSNNNIPGNLSN